MKTKSSPRLPFAAFLVVAVLMSLTGCSRSSSETGAGLPSDRFPQSSCHDCRLKPFYVNGHWLKTKKTLRG